MNHPDPSIFMQRCLQLSLLGSGAVAPNPMVGAVLVHDGRVIGEGYHQKYGEAHAEVNCLSSVHQSERHLVQASTLYVSLEPCAHFGKTPPCADLVIQNKIPHVVVGCRDPFPLVDGKGIEKLRAAGVQVETGLLEDACRELNRRFFLFHTLHRPFILLKWAQTGDGFIANEDYSRVLISNDYTNRIVHRWRSDEMAILVGTNTALFDDPGLDTRLWPGKSPVRIVVDKDLRLPSSLKLFDGRVTTIVFNEHRHTIEDLKSWKREDGGVHYYQVTSDVNLVHQLLHGLYSMGIQSVLVEGGAFLLQSFIDEGLWDEARVISNSGLFIGEGLSAPRLKRAKLKHSETVHTDTVQTFEPNNSSK